MTVLPPGLSRRAAPGHHPDERTVIMGETSDRRTRILHISEAYGGGLASAVQEYVHSTPDAEHLLAYAGRPEAPVSGQDLLPFAEIVELHHGAIKPIRTIRRLVRDRRIDLIHAHSAFGGAYARLAVRSARVPVVYTPHCYAFLRRDRRGLRWFFRLAEQALARNTTVFAACSPHEAQLSAWGGRASSIYVPNVYSGGTVEPDPPADAPADTVHLLAVGRLFAQKDPPFFAAAVQALQRAGIDVRATWVGDGDHRLREGLEAVGVHVTGWLSREESRASFIGEDTIYLHTALWEGFPFGILEAHAAGTPVIVRKIPTLADFDFPHEVTRPGGVVRAVQAIMAPGGRAAAVRDMGKPLADNTPGVQAQRLAAVYRLAQQERPAHPRPAVPGP